MNKEIIAPASNNEQINIFVVWRK